MIEFSRRSFLQGLGLGTVAALTLPKDMGIIAATLKDLESPPVMAAYARFTPPPGFLIYNMHFMNGASDWVTFHVRLVQPETLLLKIDTHKVSSADYMLMTPYMPQSCPIEVWAVNEDGKPILETISVSLMGVTVDNKAMYNRTILSAKLQHVRLDRDRAIKMGLIDIYEPEEVTEDTGQLIIN